MFWAILFISFGLNGENLNQFQWIINVEEKILEARTLRDTFPFLTVHSLTDHSFINLGVNSERLIC